MKRLSIKWIIGEDEESQPITRRQTLRVPDNITAADAQAIVNILDRYSKYTCDGAQIISSENVGDAQ